jgi:hypothetical protein
VISHAEAIDRIGDAATERHGIEHLMGDPSSDAELRAHIATCDACQHEILAWETTAAALMLAAPSFDSASASIDVLGDEAITDNLAPVPPLSADTRDRVLATIQTQGIPRGTAPAPEQPRVAPVPVSVVPALSPPTAATASAAPISFPTSAAKPASARRPVRFRWLALAAAAVLVVFVAGALLGSPLGLVHTNTNANQLRTALAESGRILEQPTHRQAALVDANGTAVGAVVIDGQNGDIVVLSNGGDETGNGSAEYHCYLIRADSPKTWLGEMVGEAGTSFWAGRVDKVTDLGRPGDVIQVVDGGTSPEFTATF